MRYINTYKKLAKEKNTRNPALVGSYKTQKDSAIYMEVNL
jgi:hypothetical protein